MRKIILMVFVMVLISVGIGGQDIAINPLIVTSVVSVENNLKSLDSNKQHIYLQSEDASKSYGQYLGIARQYISFGSEFPKGSILILEFQQNNNPYLKSKEDFIINYKDLNGDLKQVKISWPEMYIKNSPHYKLYVAEDGSTYWKENKDLDINNPTFEDAVKEGGEEEKEEIKQETKEKPKKEEKKESSEFINEDFICADFDDNGVIGFSDYLEFAKVYGTKEGDNKWDGEVDLNKDKVINFADFLEFSRGFGKGCERKVEKLGFELVDIELDSRDYLRVYFKYNGETSDVANKFFYYELVVPDTSFSSEGRRGFITQISQAFLDNIDPHESPLFSYLISDQQVDEILERYPDGKIPFYIKLRFGETKKDLAFHDKGETLYEELYTFYMSLDSQIQLINLDEFNEINLENWKVRVIREGENIKVAVFVYDILRKSGTLKIGRTLTENYANHKLSFQITNFDESTDTLYYRIMLRETDNCNCLKTQICINKRCELTNQKRKYGYLYVYESDQTYNPKWKIEAEDIISKLSSGIESITDGKVKVDFDILGEYKTDLLCWNPAVANIEYKLNFCPKCTPILTRLPGSKFRFSGQNLYDVTITQINCDKCSVSTEGLNTKILLSCDLPALHKDSTTYLRKLKQIASKDLGFDLTYYDDIFVIYGRFGRVDPNRNDRNLYYACGNVEGVIGGWSSLEFSENSLLFNGVTDCEKIHSGLKTKYDAPGWQIGVHEILHEFGAVDIYDTGLTFGLSSRKEIALNIDPRAEESVMGDRKRTCVDPFNCNEEETEFLYLDEYNKGLMGIWD
jgi:hypothetical protein